MNKETFQLKKFIKEINKIRKIYDFMGLLNESDYTLIKTKEDLYNTITKDFEFLITKRHRLICGENYNMKKPYTLTKSELYKLAFIDILLEKKKVLIEKMYQLGTRGFFTYILNKLGCYK